MVLCLVISRGRRFVAPWTVARQAPLSMGFSRQECWSGVMPSSKGSSPPRARSQIAPLQANSLPGSPLIIPTHKYTVNYQFLEQRSFESFEGRARLHPER